MTTTTSSHTTGRTDLRDRTTTFAKDVRSFVRRTPRTISSLSDCRQLVRSSGSLGSKYIEADSAANAQQFLWRMSDCRTEARRCSHWLQLLDANLEEGSEQQRKGLLKEATELEKIFGAIVGKMVQKVKNSAPKGEPVQA